MDKVIRIGTRESQLAVWQATQVQQLLAQYNFPSELVFIKSEGDIDLQTPLYEMGVQGIFTKSLDIALLNDKIDIAVHSMKDVPTQLARGIVEAAVLKRANYKDLLVLNGTWFKADAPLHFDSLFPPFPGHHSPFTIHHSPFTIATSSIRRKAQWLNRFPHHQIDNLRGNVNTRLRKVAESSWNGAIFAAAGLERIGLRPKNAVELDWMLPAPAQGAIMVVCREGDDYCLDACENFNDSNTALCTKVERDFLRTLMGGCTTPISALATISDDKIHLKANLLSVDGVKKLEIEETDGTFTGFDLGVRAAKKMIAQGGKQIIDEVVNATK